MDIIEDSNFIGTNPSIGARRPTREGFKVNANGVPLDIIAKQKANENIASNDITNDPEFAKLFGQAGTEIKDPFKKGGNEDHWISGSPAPIKPKADTTPKQTTTTETVEKIKPSEDPDDITNDPNLKAALSNMQSSEVNNESELSDSHTMNR